MLYNYMLYNYMLYNYMLYNYLLYNCMCAVVCLDCSNKYTFLFMNPWQYTFYSILFIIWN